jgi:hypothetical protein
MATVPTVNRDWILVEFAKGIDAENSLQQDAEATASSPPDPSLGLLYHEIAAADGRHRLIIETIATRYGYNPGKGLSGGLGKAIDRLKNSVSEIGSTPQARVAKDLLAKASAMHWTAAWVAAFQSIGDAESARELASVLTEQKAHHDALQEGMNRLVVRGAAEGQ